MTEILVLWEEDTFPTLGELPVLMLEPSLLIRCPQQGTDLCRVSGSLMLCDCRTSGQGAQRGTSHPRGPETQLRQEGPQGSPTVSPLLSPSAPACWTGSRWAPGQNNCPRGCHRRWGPETAAQQLLPPLGSLRAPPPPCSHSIFPASSLLPSEGLLRTLRVLFLGAQSRRLLGTC